MGRTPLLDVVLRATSLGLAAWLIAGCTWAALDLGGADRHLPSAATAAPLARAGVFGRGGAPGLRAGDVAPAMPQAAAELATVLLVRGVERLESVKEPLPQTMLYEDDPTLSVGESRLVSAGEPGTLERTYRVRIEDGLVLERRLLSEVVLDEPVPGRTVVGTRPLSLDTPFGALQYVRALNVVATYYTPANGGKALDSPWYGITATGARATRGIVAVDPRVIPMYSWLYIPGYGIAQARDVGSAIIGDHIDVAFDDGDGAWWGRRYLTVYVLAR